MKLGEALLLRGDLQKKLTSLRDRLDRNAHVQEGDTPSEPPAELLRQVDTVLGKLEKLVFAINKANFENCLADGMSITRALARREMLGVKRAVLVKCATAATGEFDRYGSRELRWVATIDIADVHKRADELAEAARQLNMAIQEANWRVEMEL